MVRTFEPHFKPRKCCSKRRLMRDAGYLASPHLVELGRRRNIEKHINSEEKKKAEERQPCHHLSNPMSRYPLPDSLLHTHSLFLTSKSSMAHLRAFALRALSSSKYMHGSSSPFLPLEEAVPPLLDQYEPSY